MSDLAQDDVEAAPAAKKPRLDEEVMGDAASDDEPEVKGGAANEEDASKEDMMDIKPAAAGDVASVTKDEDGAPEPTSVGSENGSDEGSNDGEEEAPGMPYPPYGHGYPPPYYAYPYPPHPAYAFPPPHPAHPKLQGKPSKDDDDDDDEAPPPPPPGYYPPPPYYYAPPPRGKSGKSKDDEAPPPGYYPPPPYYAPPPYYYPPQGPPPGEGEPHAGHWVYGVPPPLHAPPRAPRGRIRTTADVRNRKQRKNSLSRARAARQREKVEHIASKGEVTVEEKQVLDAVEERRLKKNDRSRQRAQEKKERLERIMAKSESERTPAEAKELEIAMAVKKRKNEGDRLRRENLKQLGLKVKPPGMVINSRTSRKPLGGENTMPYDPHMPPIPPPVMMPVPMHPPGHPYPPPAYPAPHQYFEGPPPGDDDDEEDNDDGDDADRPNSADTEQEVSRLLLQPSMDEEDIPVDIAIKKDAIGTD